MNASLMKLKHWMSLSQVMLHELGRFDLDKKMLRVFSVLFVKVIWEKQIWLRGEQKWTESW